MAKLQFEFESSGGKQLEQQFKTLSAQIEASQGNLKGLSKALGVSEKELEALAKDLGVSASGLQKLSGYLANSSAAGKTAKEQFTAIAKSIQGLKPETFDRLQKAVKGSVVDTAKAVSQTEKLADGYDKAAKSAQRAAKAGSGVNNSTFSKEASADRRNATEIARLDRQSNQKLASDDRAAKAAIAQADRISAEKQSAIKAEAEKQIAQIQANSAQDAARFSAAQSSIQREKDRALEAEIAAGRRRTDQEIAQISAATAKAIASGQRELDQQQKALDRAAQATEGAANRRLQQEVAQLNADTARQSARLDRESRAIEGVANRASNERIAGVQAQSAQEIAAEQRKASAIEGERNRAHQQEIAAARTLADKSIAAAKIRSDQKIAADRNSSNAAIAAVKAQSDRATAIQKQQLANESAERIAQSQKSSQETIAALNNEGRKQAAIAKQQLANESAEKIAEQKRQSQERIAEEKRESDQLLAEFKASSDQRTALQVQQLANESREKVAEGKRQSEQFIAAVKVEGQRETALQKQQLANESREKVAEQKRQSAESIAATKVEAAHQLGIQKQQLANESRERVAAQKQQSAETIAQLQSVQSQETALQKQQLANESREKIAEQKRASDQQLAEFKANASHQTAIQKQTLANQSREQIASEQRNSLERQKELDRNQREQLATHKAVLAAETSTYNTQLRIASAERQQELNRQLKTQENNRRAQERADAKAASDRLKAENDRARELDRQRTEQSKRSQAIAATANATGIDSQKVQGVSDAVKLTEEQIRQGIPALKKLFEAGEVTATQLRLTAEQYGIQASQAAALVPVLRARVAAEKQAAERTRQDDAAKTLAAAQEKAALGFAQVLGQPRDQALALAKDLKLTGEQMGPASRAIAKLANDSKLTGSTLADVAEQYKLNASQAKELASQIGRRVAAEKQATQAALEQSNQAKLASNADAADQKRLVAVDQFASTLGITNDAALELARRFGLSDVQMKQATAKLASLAEAGQLTESELQLVQQQFKLSRPAIGELTQAIAARVADEKDRSTQQQREKAEADLAVAAIGLGQATGLGTDAALDLARQLGLTATQAKSAPGVFVRLAKAGVTGQQAIADLSTALGLPADKAAPLAAALQKEADRIDGESIDANRKRAADRVASLLGKTGTEALDLMRQFNLTGDQSKAAAAALDGLAKNGNLTISELKRVRDTYGLSRVSTVALARAIADRVAGEKQAADDVKSASDQRKQEAADRRKQLQQEADERRKQQQQAAIDRRNRQQEERDRQKQADQADARRGAIGAASQATGLDTDTLRALSDAASLTTDQIRQGIPALKSLFAANKGSAEAITALRERYRLEDAQLAQLVPVLQARVAAEKQATQRTQEADAANALAAAQEKAGLGFAQAIGQSRDQAIALARNLKLTDQQMGPATRSILKLAQQGALTGSSLADVAEQYRLNATQAKALAKVIALRIQSEKQQADAALAQKQGQRLIAQADAMEQKRLAALDQFADAIGLSKGMSLNLATRLGLSDVQMKGAATAIGSLAKSGQLTDRELGLVREQFKLGSKATTALVTAIRDRVDREEQQATDEGNARLAQAADAAEQKRIAALSKFADALGLTPAAARELIDRFSLTGEQMRGVASSFNRLVKSNQLTGDQLALVQQSYRLGTAATDALTTAVQQRVASEQEAAARQAALDQETARQERIKKELKAAYRQEQASLEKSQKADQSRTLASLEVGRELDVAAGVVERFAVAAKLSGADLKSATRAIGKSLEAGTLDQDLTGLSSGLKLSRSAVQFLAKRIQQQADKVAAQKSAQQEADGQSRLAAAADKADRDRVAALSGFARVMGLTIDEARSLVDRFSLTGNQMKGAGKAIDQLAKAGLLTESELSLVRQQFGLGRSATAALVTAIDARVGAERAQSEAAATEAARVKQREAVQKELKTRYRQQQAALEKAEKADQSRALASVEVGRSLSVSSDQLDRFTRATGLSGEGLRSAARAIGKSVEAGTLDQDLTSLSKGLKLSESAVRFLAARIQKQADQVVADQAAQREAEGQARLAAAADKAEQQRIAVLSQFAQSMGLTINAARELVQRFGLTGDQMKGAAGAIDKLAKAGRLTTEELSLVQQRFSLGSASVAAMSAAIAQRVRSEQEAIETQAAATAETKRQEATKKALKASYKQQQVALEKAQKTDQSRAQAAIALSQSTGVAADRLARFADATGLGGSQLRAAVSQISQSVKAGTLDRDLATLSRGLNVGESAIRFLAKRIQQQADATEQASLSRAALPLSQAIGQTTAETIELAQRLGLTAEQLRSVPAAFSRLTKAGVTGEQAITDLARTTGLTDQQSRELAAALQSQVDRLKSQKSQQQLGEIGAKQKAAYEAALTKSAQQERARATEAAKQAGKLGLSAEQTDRFAKAANLGAQELRSAVGAIAGLVKSGTDTSAALEQLAPGLGLSATAAKFLAKRLKSQADADSQDKQAAASQKEAQRLATQVANEQARQARQLTAIGQQQRDAYATAQASLTKELDKQRVAAIGFGQAIGTTSDRALRYAQALGLGSTQIAAVGPQIQKLLSAGDLQGALSLLTNTYKLSERSARLLIGKVEQRIQSEQAASDAARQQADLQKAADAELKRRQQVADQESTEARKRIEALQGFADAVGQTPDQVLVLANVLKLSSGQMRALPKAIARLVQSGNDTDAALKRLGDTYGVQDRQLQKLTNSVRSQVERQGQSRLAAGADAQDRTRVAALPGLAAATGLTEAAARDLVTRFNLTGAQMQLVSGEMARLAGQGKLTGQVLGLLGQRAGLGAAAQQELAAALQARADAERSSREDEALRSASLQLSQSLGVSGEDAIALARQLQLGSQQVKILTPKLVALARQGDITELALDQLKTATGVPLPALQQLAAAIRANVVAQEQSADQSGLIRETAKLASQLGLTADQALRLGQKLNLSAQAIGQVDALKKLYAQGPVSEAALAKFRDATGLAATEFNRLAVAVRSRVALEQRQASEQSTARDAARSGRAAAAEGKSTAGIIQKLDIDVTGLQKLQAESGKSAVELQKVFAALDKLEDSSATAEQKVELLARSFNLTNQQAQQLVATFDRAKTSARELGQNVSSAAQDLGLTYGAALNLQKALGMTSQQFEQAAQRAVMLRQTGATTAQAFDALNKEFGLTREQFNQLDRAALGSQQAMQGLAAAVGSFSAVFVGGLQSALQTFGEFEGELRKAGVLSESFSSKEGREAFAGLEDEVRKLGASTSFTNKQIAEASTELVKSGFSAEQTSQAIGGIAKGAIATGESMQQLSEVTGAALNNFGLAASASGYINDLVVATANASPAGVEDIGEALKYVGASASEADQSVDDVMKMIAQLASVGIKGSTAGTGLAESLRRLKLASAGSVTEFSNLVRGNKRAVGAFQALQLEARNADGSMKPLPQIIEQLRKSTAGFAQEDKDVLMNALFGVEGGRVIQAQLNLTEEKLAQIDKAFNNASGASARAADQMQQGFAGSLVAAQGAIEGFQTAIGSALAPVMTYLLQVFTGFLGEVTKGFNGLPGPVKGTVGALVGLAATLTTVVAAAAAFRAAAIALGIAQGLAAAKTVALNVALAAQQGSLLNVAKAMLGFGAATTATSGVTGLAGGLGALKAGVVGLPALLAAVGLSIKGLAFGLGKMAGAAALAFLAFEALKGITGAFQAISGQTGQALEFQSALDGIPKQFAEIEAKNPFRKVSEQQDEAFLTVQALKTEYENLGATLNTVFQNISERGIVGGAQQSLIELQAVLTGSTQALSKYGDAWGFVTQEQLANQALAIKLGNQEAINQKLFDDSQKALIDYRNALKAAGGNVEAEAVKQSNAAAEESIAKLRVQIEALRKAGPDGAIALKPLEAMLKNLENRNPAIRPKVKVDPEQAKEEAEKAKNAAKEELEEEQLILKAEIDLEFDEAKAKRKLAFDQLEQRESLEFSQQQDRDKLLFERQLDDEKRRLEAAQNAAKAKFDRRQQASKIAFDAQERAKQQAFEQASNARKTAFDQATNARKEAFERGQESKKATFEMAEESRKNAFSDQQRVKESDFNRAQELRKRDFESSQLAARKAFEDRLAARDAAKKGEFDAQRAAVDRQLQLEAAGSDAERAQLKEQFAKEDAQQARREQLLKDVIAKEKAWEEQKRIEQQALEEQERIEKELFEDEQRIEKENYDLSQRELERAFKEEQRAAERLFQEEQWAAEQSFEESQRITNQAFEDAENKRKIAFEDESRKREQAFQNRQETARRNFENQLANEKELLERQLLDKKMQFDQEQARAKLQFDQEQDRQKAAFESSERLIEKQHKEDLFRLEAEFKKQQRELDKQVAAESAKAVSDSSKEVVEAAKDLQSAADDMSDRAGSPNPIPRRMGGPAETGRVYEVGEQGREIFVPQQNGRILSARDSARVAERAMSIGQMQHLAIAAPSAPKPSRPEKGPTLGDVIQSIGQVREGLARLGGHTFNFVGNSEPGQDVYAVMRSMRRSAIA